jgi:hypothetical protein
MSVNIINSTPPNLKINAKEHFWISGLKRSFDLSAITPLYLYVSNNYKDLDNGKDYEFTIGRSTICFSVQNNTINLITGWAGNRKKRYKN